MMTPLLCLVTAMFFEARDQSITGMEMVAEVIMNRVEHPSFPDTVCDVVYERKQFSFANEGHASMYDYQEPEDRMARYTALGVALRYLQGDRLGSTSTHYHKTTVSPEWKSEFVLDGKVEDHIFYTCYENC